MIQKITALIAVLILILYIPAAEVSADSDQDSYYYIVIDKETGMILLEQNSHERIFPASTTKILTAYTALLSTGITSVFTVSPIASGPMETGAVRLGLIEGEQMQFYDMLHALMLKSANDIAVSIAENISGSVEDFSLLMNETAEKAGALDTHFVNPHGLHDDEHYTTPYDLAMISRKALDNFTFATVVSREEFVLPATNKHDEFPTLRNSNPILGSNEGYDFIVTGVKTGYTSKAKFTLVSSARDFTGRDVICVVANIPSRSESAALSLELMKRAFEEYSVQSVSSSGGLVNINGNDDPGYDVATAMNIEYLMPVDQSGWKLDYSVEIYPGYSDNPSKGSIIGEISFTYDGIPIGSSYLVSAEDLSVEENKNTYEFTDFPEESTASFPLRFLVPMSGFLAVVFLLFFLAIRYNKNKDRSEENAI